MAKLTGQHIVGRNKEVQLLGDTIHEALPYSIVNIYGPGGIGKTVVCQKFEAWCAKMKIPYATMAGDDSTTLTIDKMLYRFRKGLEESATEGISGKAFNDFDKKFKDYLVVKEVIDKGGGIAKMFDVAGSLLDHVLLKALLDTVEGTYEGIKKYFSHRDALERYIGGADRWLTESFVEGVKSIVEDERTKVVLLIDTYEEMEGWDDWIRGTFVKALPADTKVVILGRNRLNEINFDWGEYVRQDLLDYHELQELSEGEAKAYLYHYGLRDKDSLDRMYSFTGGYPLCLVLAVELAKELGWEGVGEFKHSIDRDWVASQLLERILREEKVQEVQEFLEKGVVVQWFDPEAVSYILEINPEQGREIYHKIRKFSFVQRHPNGLGLKFHDKVRELLEHRLRFMDDGKTYLRLAERWSEYLIARAGI